MKPSLREEKKLWRKGYKNVVGLDEAGRGPLAGPVVASAVIITTAKIKNLKEVKDSKQLSSKKREEIYKIITNPPVGGSQVKWGIGRVSEKVIDKINILEATKLAMIKAIKNLAKPYSNKVDFLILDGKMKIDLPIAQKSIVKADEKVLSCAIASIISKVSRDRMMRRMAKKYPRYRFDKHKGYGTKLHFKMLKKYGPCKIHRRSFKPVRKT